MSAAFGARQAHPRATALSKQALAIADRVLNATHEPVEKYRSFERIARRNLVMLHNAGTIKDH